MAANRHEPHDEQEFPAPDKSRPETLYEHRDVNTLAVGKFGIGLVLLTILSIAMLIGVFRFFASRVGGPLSAGQVKVDARRLPPQPRLQENPVQDLEQVRAAEERLLNGYGWVDRPKGIVRIPVARAMELLAQRPPAARAQGEAPPDSGVSLPTESGLGLKAQRAGGPLADEMAHGAGGHEAPAAAAHGEAGKK